jgi:3-oxosteroid 1-dehydrogenase
MGTFAGEYDVVVVGSGAGGLTAAITGALDGQSVLVVEKLPFYGGTTAISGGSIWLPGNSVVNREGGDDSVEKGRTYIQALLGDRSSPERRERYLSAGPLMIDELETRTKWLRFKYSRGYPDSYPELPGGAVQGRSIGPQMLEADALGQDLGLMAKPLAALGYRGLIITAADFHDLNMVMRTWEGKQAALRVLARTLKAKAPRRKTGGGPQLGNGRALVGRLWLALKELGVTVWLSAPLLDLETEPAEGGEAVVGVRVERKGVPVSIRARRGVVLASGGFSHAADMRDQFLRRPQKLEWTMSPEGQTGDSIRLGMKLGAGVELMDQVWGQPATIVPADDGELRPNPLLAERSLPGTMVVDGEGRRYQNEAGPYVEFVERMYERQASGTSTIPSWMIFDQRAKNRYIFLKTLPLQPFPRQWFERGLIRRSRTIEQLGSAIGVPPTELAASLRRYNQFAAAGNDDDFHKGDSAADRYYGDPTLPNPCLYPIAKPPFYAIPVYAGETGTRGGLEVDEWARVLREDGTPIQGLHAVGNTAASVMGNVSTGPGQTIGAAMAFGYVAAKYLAGHAQDIGDPTQLPASCS